MAVRAAPGHIMHARDSSSGTSGLLGRPMSRYGLDDNPSSKGWAVIAPTQLVPDRPGQRLDAARLEQPRAFPAVSPVR